MINDIEYEVLNLSIENDVTNPNSDVEISQAIITTDIETTSTELEIIPQVSNVEISPIQVNCEITPAANIYFNFNNSNYINFISSANIPIYTVVSNSSSGLIVADPTILFTAWSILGITLEPAVIGSDVLIQNGGIITNENWNWETNKPIFLGANGTLTQYPNTTTASYLLQVATDISPTSLLVHIQAIQLF